MLAEERRSRLLEFVRLRRFASLPELAEQLEVSESTVRRDLEHLERQGSTRRIHGGVLYAGSSPKMPHFDARQSAKWGQKRAIAAKAAELIEDGDTILLDGGSTTYEVARLRIGRPQGRGRVGPGCDSGGATRTHGPRRRPTLRRGRRAADEPANQLGL